jgi:hypothetical protein
MSAVIEPGDMQHSDLTARDRTHAAYTQLQLLLKAIRASPGLERFMRGPSYTELVQVASAQPVIILFASDAACHALVISSQMVSPVHLILESIKITDVEVLGHDLRGLDLNVRAISKPAVAAELRAMSVSGRNTNPAVRKLHQALKRLWVGIVKPILVCLGLEVCKLTATRP